MHAALTIAAPLLLCVTAIGGNDHQPSLIPAKAGIHIMTTAKWIPAFAGMTNRPRFTPKFPAADSTAPLTRLFVLKGVWKSVERDYGTEFSKPSRSSLTLRNDCWQSGAFYACDQIINGVSKALVVFTRDPKSSTYNSYAIRTGGATPYHGSLKIVGDTWTYGAALGAKPDSVQFRTVNTFGGPNSIKYRNEYSRDGKNWTLMSDGLETRQSQ